MSIGPFIPQFLFESELQQFGLPTVQENQNIISLVQFASNAIDEYCGRIDGDGNGSLVYTTYTERILLQTRNRNLAQLAFKPIIGVPQSTVDSLSGLAVAAAASGQPNIWYTGVQASTVTSFVGDLSGFIGASGRYGYTRQDRSVGYPDLYAMINPLNLVTIFGGPAPWVQVDITNLDYSSQTGECWFPAGLQLQAYSEIICVYNSGFSPTNLPRTIKNVCASLVKNLMLGGEATTNMVSLNLGRGAANVQFGKGIFDTTLDQMLCPFKIIRAY